MKKERKNKKLPIKEKKEVTKTKIKCAICGKEETVPFVPNRGIAVLCWDCYQAKKKREQRNKELIKRVAGKFEIVCERCGKEETVDYKRYSAPVKLCDKCFLELKGDVPKSPKKKKLGVLTRIKCCRCGKEEFVNFVPEDENTVLCSQCYAMDNKKEGD